MRWGVWWAGAAQSRMQTRRNQHDRVSCSPVTRSSRPRVRCDSALSSRARSKRAALLFRINAHALTHTNEREWDWKGHMNDTGVEGTERHTRTRKTGNLQQRCDLVGQAETPEGSARRRRSGFRGASFLFANTGKKREKGGKRTARNDAACARPRKQGGRKKGSEESMLDKCLRISARAPRVRALLVCRLLVLLFTHSRAAAFSLCFVGVQFFR